MGMMTWNIGQGIPKQGPENEKRGPVKHATLAYFSNNEALAGNKAR